MNILVKNSLIKNFSSVTINTNTIKILHASYYFGEIFLTNLKKHLRRMSLIVDI